MIWLLGGIAFWLALGILKLLIAYVLCPLVWFAFAYLWYMLIGIIITVLVKIRYEVFNGDLKFTPKELKNRLLVITGAGSGIGLTLTRRFLRQGFVVVGCYFSEDEPGYAELEELSDAHRKPHHQDRGKLFLVKLDIRSLESISSSHAAVERILADDPKLMLHALINVAGVGTFHKFQWLPEATIKNTVETNLTGPMLLTRKFLHLLIKTPQARVVNVSSPLGILPVDYNAVYGPTKAGLSHFSSCLRTDLVKYGVKTVTILPGNLIKHTAIINSSLNQNMDSILGQLNEDERDLYRDEIDEHRKLLGAVSRAHSRRRKFTDMRPARKTLFLIAGGIVEDNLKDSISFLLSFENSVHMRNPPSEMFAGNMLFNLVVETVLQWTPRILLRLFSLIICNEDIKKAAVC